MTEENKNIQRSYSATATNDNLREEVEKVYSARSDFERRITDSIVKRNAFWAATEYDEDTGLKEIVICEDDLGKDYCTAYTYPEVGLVNDHNKENSGYGVFTMDEIYREMIHEQVDYLTIWSTDGYTDIYINELYDIMTNLQGKF